MWKKLIYRLGLFLGLCLLLYQIARAYTSLAEHSFQVNQPLFLLAALAAVIVALSLQMAAWSIMVSSFGRRLPISESAKGYFLSFLPRYIPGSIWGYLSRGEWLKSAQQIPYSITNLCSALEAGLLLINNLLIVGLYFALKLDGPGKLIALGGIIVLPFLMRMILNKALRLEQFRKLFFRNENKVHLMFPLSNWLLINGLYAGLWLAYGSAAYFVVKASLIDLKAGIAVFPFIYNQAWLAGFLTVFIPTGLGVRELAMANLLVQNIGIGFSQANVMAILMRFATLAGEAAWIAIGLLIKKSHQSPANPMRVEFPDLGEN
jgi:glycosyltransferase 2 family protein